MTVLESYQRMEQLAKAMVTEVCEKYNTTGKGAEKLTPEQLESNIEFCCKQPDYIKTVEDWVSFINWTSEKALEVDQTELEKA